VSELRELAAYRHAEVTHGKFRERSARGNRETPLKQLGFFRSVEGAQVVYEKRHDCNPDVRVKVYTSIKRSRKWQ
jgi:hypothetical protein